jgi:hypothetical protein
MPRINVVIEVFFVSSDEGNGVIEWEKASGVSRSGGGVRGFESYLQKLLEESIQSSSDL